MQNYTSDEEIEVLDEYVEKGWLLCNTSYSYGKITRREYRCSEKSLTLPRTCYTHYLRFCHYGLVIKDNYYTHSEPLQNYCYRNYTPAQVKKYVGSVSYLDIQLLKNGQRVDPKSELGYIFGNIADYYIITWYHNTIAFNGKLFKQLSENADRSKKAFKKYFTEFLETPERLLTREVKEYRDVTIKKIEEFIKDNTAEYDTTPLNSANLLNIAVQEEDNECVNAWLWYLEPEPREEEKQQQENSEDESREDGSKDAKKKPGDDDKESQEKGKGERAKEAASQKAIKAEQEVPPLPIRAEQFDDDEESGLKWGI